MTVYVILVIVAIVGQLILNILIDNYLTKLKILILTYLAQGPKFYDEIDSYIKQQSQGRVSSNWIFLPMAIHQLEMIYAIRKRKELHPVFKEKRWRYKLNPIKPSKERITDWVSLLEPAPGFNCESSRAPS